MSNDEALDRRIIQVCDAVGAFIEYWGFKAVHGRVWTLAALRTQPISQTQIADLLGVSRSLVSAVVAELSERGLLRPISSHRNAPYVAVMDVWPTISDVLRAREWMLLEQARMALEGAIEEALIARAAQHPLAYDLTRLRTLAAMTDVAQALLRILISIRMPKATEGFTDWLGRATRLIKKLRALR